MARSTRRTPKSRPASPQPPVTAYSRSKEAHMAISDVATFAHLSETDVEALGREFDAIRRDIEESRGADDAAYISRIISIQRRLMVAARLTLFASSFPPAWVAQMLQRLGIKSEFAAGLRITDAATIEIVEMVLAGSINKALVGYINEAGGKAVGLCGKDGNMVTASKATRTMVDPDSHIEKVVDLGFVGEPEHVDLTLLNQLIGHELIPVRSEEH